MIIRISRISATIPHAELIFRTVIKKLWAFFGLGVEIARSHRYAEKRQFFRVRRIQQSTASLRTSQLLLSQKTRVSAGMMC